MFCDDDMDAESTTRERTCCLIRDGKHLRDPNAIPDPLFVMHYGSTLLPSDDRTRAGYRSMRRWRRPRLIPTFRRGILDGPWSARRGYWGRVNQTLHRSVRLRALAVDTFFSHAR